MAERPEIVCVGAVSGARGVRGDVRIKSFTADPDDLTAYGPLTDETGARRFDVRITGHAKGQLIARIAGVDDRDAADAMKGTKLCVRRNALPEPDDNEFYVADLIGMEATDRDGEPLGTVTGVENFGAGDILEIGGTGEPQFMVPFTKEAVLVVDLARRKLVVERPSEAVVQEDGTRESGAART